MSDKLFTVMLPDELIRRVENSDIGVAELVQTALENELERREATRRFLQLADDLHSVPDELKPTPEEIDGMVKQARRELREERKAAEEIKRQEAMDRFNRIADEIRALADGNRPTEQEIINIVHEVRAQMAAERSATDKV